MDPIRFDRLAKAVAAPVPRRTLLVGALAAALGRRRDTAAQLSPCCQGCADRGQGCDPDPRGGPGCTCCGQEGKCGNWCCKPGQECVLGQRCEAPCPANTQRCGDDQRCVPVCPRGVSLNLRSCECECPGGVICGLEGAQECCRPGFVCIGNRCLLPPLPPAGQTCAVGAPCGSACCPPGQECSDPDTGFCCPTGTSCGRVCAGGGDARHALICCDPDFSLRCDVASQECCEGACCDRATERCLGGYCLPRLRRPRMPR